MGVPAKAITTYDNPANHVAGGGTVTTAGVNLDGVAQIFTSIGACSGALMADGIHILTAGHCVNYGGSIAASATVNFFTGAGDFSFTTSNISVAPGWSGIVGSELSGSDLAILTLSSVVSGVQGYDLYRGASEVGQSIELAGWGYGGTGSGYNSTLYPYGTRRWGVNQYDTTGALFGNSNSTILMGDFDDGTAAHDLFGTLSTALVNRGLTDADIAPGDSGGPTFWNGLLVGIHSFTGRINFTPQPDIDGGINSSYGELWGDSRVSANLSFIDSVLLPEPSAFALAAFGLVILSGVRSKRVRRDRCQA